MRVVGKPEVIQLDEKSALRRLMHSPLYGNLTLAYLTSSLTKLSRATLGADSRAMTTRKLAIDDRFGEPSGQPRGETDARPFVSRIVARHQTAHLTVRATPLFASGFVQFSRNGDARILTPTPRTMPKGFCRFIGAERI